MPRVDLSLAVDPARDDFVLWLRWVAMESPPTPNDPPDQGVRVQMQINRRSVFGPEIHTRASIPEPGRLLLIDPCAWRGMIATRPAPKYLDLQLTIHGSVANAPYLALFHLRDETRDRLASLSPQSLGTPLLQLQPSVPAGHWQVAGQVNLRVALRPIAPGGHLRVLED